MEKSAEIKSVISCSGFNSTKELFESYMQAVWLKGISLCVSLYEYIIFGKRSTYKGTDGINKSNVNEYSCAVTPQVRQTGNRLSGPAGTAYASLLT